ncbi:ABC transporter ATP-binding protein [Haploplasma axanthum]|nr:ABC transporter A family member [Haploplasma axanthum]
MNAIEIKQLRKEYKDRVAVDDLTFNIKEGEFFALLGFNGAGKTTTIKMLTGLLKPTSGDALVFGKSIITDMNSIKEYINISPQETAIAPNLTVFENLVFIAEIYGFKKEIAKTKANLLLEQFKLTDRKNDKSKKLSGGLKRRLSIAMSLITNPKIIFLDEPTLGLDVRSRRELWHILNELKGNVTVILTTHYLDEVEALSDSIAIIDKGNLKAIGSLDELKKQSGLEKLEDIFLTLIESEEVL